MLLLTGILPKLKSDPVRDTMCVYKSIKSQRLDVTGMPVGPDGLGPAPPGPAPSVGSTTLLWDQHPSPGPHLEKRK